ncbi:MAG: Yip1 family protein [Halobacteriaceae archaeon]
MFPELFTQPTNYFEERVKYPRLKVQLGIVALVGLAANFWRLWLRNQLGGNARVFEGLLVIFTGVGVIEFVVWWLVLTFVMHVLATFLGGRSKYGDLLRLTGFGFWPMILSGIVFSLGWMQALGPYTSGAETLGQRAGNLRNTSFRQTFQEFNLWLVKDVSVYSDPALIAAVAVGSFFIIASGVLWVRAVQVVTGLEEPRAALTAAVPVLILMFRVFQPIFGASAETAFAL